MLPQETLKAIRTPWLRTLGHLLFIVLLTGGTIGLYFFFVFAKNSGHSWIAIAISLAAAVGFIVFQRRQNVSADSVSRALTAAGVEKTQIKIAPEGARFSYRKLTGLVMVRTLQEGNMALRFGVWLDASSPVSTSGFLKVHGRDYVIIARDDLESLLLSPEQFGGALIRSPHGWGQFSPSLARNFMEDLPILLKALSERVEVKP